MRKWYPAILIIVMIVITAIVYPRLPAEVPRHWSLHGTPNGYWSKSVSAIAGPVVLLALLAVFRILPRIDPRSASYDRMRGTYDLMVNAVLTLLAALHLSGMAYALGVPLDVSRITAGAIALSLIVVGNVLPRARPNWWFGIRTPWTLSNDRVWERTQRFGGYVMTAGGVVALAMAVLGIKAPIGATLAVVGVAGVAVVLFSYVTWTRETPR